MALDTEILRCEPCRGVFVDGCPMQDCPFHFLHVGIPGSGELMILFSCAHCEGEGAMSVGGIIGEIDGT
jgi:hypothetical protein